MRKLIVVMFYIYKKRVVWIFVLAALLLPHLTAAQEEQSALKVAPAYEQIVLKRGELISKEVTLTNLANVPLPVKAYVRSFVATDEVGGADYPDDQTPKSVQQWFKITEPDFILQPKASRTVKLLINVPRDAEPGGHYATLFFESLVPKEVLNETSLFLASRVGALYFFVVAGEIKERGQVESVKVNRFQLSGPISFEMTFSNNGNVHLKPKSKFEIRRGNKVVAQFQDAGQTVMPGKKRRWQVDWPQKNLFGKYTAVITTQISEEAPPLSSKVSFYVLPIHKILWITLLVGLWYAVLIKGRRRITKAWRVLRNDKKSPS